MAAWMRGEGSISRREAIPLSPTWDADDRWPADEGCDLHPSCLTCPLPACRYDLPPKRAGALLRAAAVRALLAQGLTVDEVAARMRVSRRTVYRLKATFG